MKNSQANEVVSWLFLEVMGKKNNNELICWSNGLKLGLKVSKPVLITPIVGDEEMEKKNEQLMELVNLMKFMFQSEFLTIDFSRSS